MGTTPLIISGIVALLVIVFGGWRLASRRRSLPCPVWLRWMVELDNPFTKTNRAAVILEHLGVQPGMAVLDAGCGPGRLAIPAARLVGESGTVLAVDMQRGMLDRAMEKSRAEGLRNIQFLQAELGGGNVGQNRFDRALLVTVLGEIPDRETALKELFGALKPGGMLSVTEVILDPHFQPRGATTRLAGAAGFREKAFFGNRFAYTIHFERPVQV